MEDFLKLVREKYDIADSKKIEQAYKLANMGHSGNTRQSGEPWVNHCICIGKLLLELNMDSDTVCAGLLHDALDDTDITAKQISDNVGGAVADLCKGLSKINGIKYGKSSVSEVESLRRLIIAMGKDLRVVIIKLADRVHNMRTIDYLPREKQIKYATETQEVFAGLAERLGLSKFKRELDDLCFKTLNPDEYAKLKAEVERKFDKWQEQMRKISGILEYLLKENSIKGKVTSRFKNYYSLYKKLQKKGTGKTYDIIAFRILVDNVEDCYKVLGAVHQKFRPIAGRIKDYIAAPKQNGYQSLHTTLITSDGTPFELQIRTFEMHEYCEVGVASHWNYKGDVDKSSYMLQERLDWLKNLIESEMQLTDDKNFVKTLKMDFSTGEIWVFTPKHKPISLPEKSTPIDFAYAIHTELGHKCIGAKVNGKKVSLATVLDTGDEIEILTSQESKGPSRDWLNVAITHTARYAIRQFFRKETTPENIIFGKKILEEEARKVDISIGDIISDNYFKELQEKYSFESVDDMFASVGYKSVTVNQILKPIITKKELQKEQSMAKEYSPVLVEGKEVLNFRLSQCCSPIPGDKIVAIANRDTFGIHTTDCKNQKYIDSDRCLKAEWKDCYKKQYPVHIVMNAIDRPGILADILTYVYKYKITFTGVTAQILPNNKFEMTIALRVVNKDELDKFVKYLKQSEASIEWISRKNLG